MSFAIGRRRRKAARKGGYGRTSVTKAQDAEPESDRYADWLEGTINSEAPYGLSDLVLSGFMRIVTHPRILSPPATIDEALAFTETIRSQPQCVTISPGPRHWRIFTRLCKEAGTRGNLVPDAYLAAMAMESGSEWITMDRDFARFPGLRWRHPLS